MEYEGITLQKEAGVAVLTLNRPEQLNAVTLPMAYSLAGALEEIQDDTDVKAIIITGAILGIVLPRSGVISGAVIVLSLFSAYVWLCQFLVLTQKS